MSVTGMPSVMQMTSGDARVGRLEDRVGRERRRHEDHAERWRRSPATASSTVSKTGTCPGLLNSGRLAGRRRRRRCCVPYSSTGRRGSCRRAGDALDQDAGCFVDENAHRSAPPSFRPPPRSSSRRPPCRRRRDVEARSPRGSRGPSRRWCPRAARPAAPAGRPPWRGDDALGDDVALHDAAEDVDEDALHLGVREDDLERLRSPAPGWRRRPRRGSWPARRRSA